MSWQDYFVYDDVHECYRYRDKEIISLPHDLPMPPINNFGYLFSGCKYLQDISTLATWDVSNVTNTRYMFAQCWRIQDISALVNWDISNVTDTKDMFYGCCREVDITSLLGKHDRYDRPIIGESALIFRWEINKLNTHIARLEEKITALAEMI